MIRFALAVILALIVTPSGAREFGNGVGSDAVERSSRQASAQALEGLERVFVAIRQRELEGPAAGAATLRDAVGRLRRAAADIGGMRPSLRGRISLDRVPEQERAAAVRALSRLGLPPSSTQEELFSRFEVATRDFANFLDRFAQDTPQGPLLPLIINELFGYLDLGIAVTRLARTAG